MECASVVQAAGCVLWRRSSAHQLELALVYRPRWADWSWPKGKLKRGETHEEAARREVLEETGHTCRLGAALPTARYIDHQNRRKEVRYWAAEATGGTFESNDEVSDLVWLRPDEARDRVTHDRDRDLISAALIVIVTGEDMREL
ncbi:NUDIX hydrolase [Streptomyces sp. NBC_00078]|uniref:NUDIX hydrolase n=1 Tax=unclassified Streptomyces TaxID=2593676 RepID=UPI0022596A8E|nr:NUDIX hydrolase [Streptomyces sp. NBC_00078]MCX5421840.1 NUDIX hydrolase [Streptomyces sp. NBC_00078]